jgi:hypothetical protein
MNTDISVGNYWRLPLIFKSTKVQNIRSFPLVFVERDSLQETLFLKVITSNLSEAQRVLLLCFSFF